MRDFTAFQTRIGVTFTDKDLLKQAFVHRSYLNEEPNYSSDHNERLEFLGDAVLELATTDFLYKNYPNPEGELTNWRSSLVNWRILSDIGSTLGMSELMFLSKGESQQTGRARDVILANAMEALIGAIYLDQGYAVAERFITDHVLVQFDHILENSLFVDAKSKFQEAAQERLSITPEYKVIEESGPDHNKRFVMGAYLGSELIARGEGSNKQEAETAAAKGALQEKDW